MEDRVMEKIIRRAEQRGVGEHGWLHARFSFSFAEYYDPSRMGFGVLRVLNNDIVEAGAGFEMHPHKDMEIITYVLRGALEHHDSKGNHGVINAGEIQYMSAGSGVYHSEKNPSNHESVELFQIWIYPKEKGGDFLYEQRSLQALERTTTWQLLVSDDGRENSIKIKQNACIYLANLEAGEELELQSRVLGHGRTLMVVEGSASIDESVLYKRDEMQIRDTHSYTLKAMTQTRLLLFEVPMLQDKS
jgi:redox-sensitive bicupin YhaK (pirin superfamily)